MNTSIFSKYTLITVSLVTLIFGTPAGCEENKGASTTPPSSSSANLEKNVWFAQLWKKISPLLSNILTMEEETERLPDSSWWGPDKQDQADQIDKLLEEAVTLLSTSNTTEIRQQIHALEQNIHEAKNTIANYRQAQVAAPIQSVWETTVSEYDAKIKGLSEQIDRYENALVQLKTEFAQTLAQQGLSISQEQLEALLSSVVGDNFIQSSTVYHHVKQITQQLLTLTANSKGDLEISKRYYGLYTVLLKILLHLQQGFLTQLDNQYLPKLEQIRLEVERLQLDTRRLLLGKDLDDSRRRHLQANLDAQELTLKTALLYKQYLQNYRDQVTAVRDKTVADLQIAQNTYKTVKLSGELLDLLRLSQQAFDLLLNLQTPELLVFENLQMKQEFAILTQKLK